MEREVKRLGAIVLGTPTLEPLEVPLLARRTAHIRPTPGRIVELVAETIGLERGEIFDLRRGGPGASARAIAIQIGLRFGVPMSATGDAVGIRKSAASRLGSRALDDVEKHVVDLIHVRLVREVRTRE